MSSKLKNDEKVHVAIRCRPTNENEKSNRIKSAVTTLPKDKEIQVTCNNNLSKIYKFDKVFGPTSKQVDVYRSVVEPHIDEVLAGYNCTVLAYGQTGTGKTFTMEGERSGENYTWENDPKAGIIPRTLSQLFDRLEKESTEFSIHVSLLEIYNEVIYDLLSPTEVPAKRRIYDDGNRKGSVIIAEQTEVRVLDKSQVYAILEQGATKRRTDATLMNEFSSRSHSVFTITVHSKELTKNGFEEEELVKIGKLNLVDLAGSENIGRSGAVEQRAREAGNINQSLLTLGRCITALVDHAPHIPYRESRLTRILQDSLGGATKTSIIATISPGVDNLEETLSTLDYASRAKNIQNRPKVNQRMTKRTLIKQYDNEIENLRRELMATREKNGVYMDKKQYDDMSHRLEELEVTLLQRQDELDNFKTLFTNLTEDLRVKSDEYTILRQQFEETHAELMNKSYLEKIKGEHGQKAVEDGNEVATVADEVTKNIRKVHDKEERWKTADEKNQIAAESHYQAIEKEAGNLGEQTQEMVQLSKIYADNCVKTIAELSESTEQERNEISAILEEFKAALSKNITECITALSDMVQSASQLTDEKNAIITQKKESMECGLQKIHEDCAILQKGISTKIQSMSKLTTNTDSFIRNHSREQHQMVVQHSEKMKEYGNAIIKSTQAMKEEQEDHLDSAMDAMLDAIKKQVSQVKRKQAGLMDSHVATVVSSTQSIDAGMSEIVTKSASMKDTLDEESQKFLNKAQSDVRSIEESVQSLVKVSAENAESSNRLMQESVECMLTTDRSMSENLDGVEKRVKVFADDSNELASALCTNTMDLQAEIGRTFLDDTQSMRDSLQNVLDLDGKISATIGASTALFIQQTAEFCQHGLHRVEPTGETPARKDYVYPKNFQHLPPDDELLRSYHEKMLLEEEEKEEESISEIGSCDEEGQSADSALGETAESDEVDENESIHCGGGMPFFMAGKAQHDSKHHAKAKVRSRLPLRATNNVQ